MKRATIVLASVMIIQALSVVFSEGGDTGWMARMKYGIFMHYQYRILLGYSWATKRSINKEFPDPSEMSAAHWNELVNGFDVDGFADQMAAGRVGWVLFCIDDHFFAWHCSPSKKFNAYTGYGPGEKGSRRDLIAELADALDDRAIKLILYLGGMNGYIKDSQTMAGLNDDETYRTPPSVASRQKHLEILQEYATRYGDRVAGWWFDMFKTGYEAPPHDVQEIRSIVGAANPDAVIAFALNGPPFGVKQAGVDSYTGGDHFFEIDFDSITPEKQPAPKGVLWHAKIFCGDVYHGQGTRNRFSDQQLIDWINTCNHQGGVCTLDWPFDPKTGLLKEFGANQLKRIGEAIKGSESSQNRSNR